MSNLQQHCLHTKPPNFNHQQFQTSTESFAGFYPRRRGSTFSKNQQPVTSGGGHQANPRGRGVAGERSLWQNQQLRAVTAAGVAQGSATWMGSPRAAEPLPLAAGQRRRGEPGPQPPLHSLGLQPAGTAHRTRGLPGWGRVPLPVRRGRGLSEPPDRAA